MEFMSTLALAKRQFVIAMKTLWLALCLLNIGGLCRANIVYAARFTRRRAAIAPATFT